MKSKKLGLKNSEIINTIILVVLILLVILSFNLFKNYFKSDVTILDDVKLKENVSNNNGFALMLQKDDGTYEQSDSSTWPTNMLFNSELSGCIDANGNAIENGLSYNASTNSVKVKVSGTAYCYLYFDIGSYCNDGEVMGECLLRRNSEIKSLNDNIEAELYRYKGNADVVNDNYICFGTSRKEDCINNPEHYMYRIIGITQDAKIKLIKNISLFDSYMWHSDETADISWAESDLFKALNGISGGYYDGISPSIDWSDAIAYTSWKYGDITDELFDSVSNESLIADKWSIMENGWSNTIGAKIGLMYMHDYYYSYRSGTTGSNIDHDYSNDLPSSGIDTGLPDIWISLSQPGVIYGKTVLDESDYLDTDEYTMTRYVHANEVDSNIYAIRPNGLNARTVSTPSLVRPVFFTTSCTFFAGGNGTKDDPFMITYNICLDQSEEPEEGTTEPTGPSVPTGP